MMADDDTLLNLHAAAPRDDITKPQRLAQRIDAWKRMALHERHPHELYTENIDHKASNYWLTRGNLFP